MLGPVAVRGIGRWICRRGCALALVAMASLGCDAPEPPAPAPLVVAGTAWECSQLHRALVRWQGQNQEIAQCGPDVTGMVELTPLGADRLLARRRFSGPDDLWRLSPTGAADSPPAQMVQVAGAGTAGFTLLPGLSPSMFSYDPRLPAWHLYIDSDDTGLVHSFSSPASGAWPEPWNHQILGLENGHLLDRDLGDGSVRIWTFSPGPDKVVTLPAPTIPASAPSESFRRGHRLAYLGPGRLLEWLPRRCGADQAPGSDACVGSDYHVWSYALDTGAPFAPQASAPGWWHDVGAESDIVGDGTRLYLWTRASGRLRAYRLDPAASDPLDATLVSADSPPNAALHSDDWHPPTAAPAIKHLVLILQDGRSFDSYFGRYCRGPLAPDTPESGMMIMQPRCDKGRDCCEAIPPAAGPCVDPAANPSYRPGDAPSCMRLKMNGGAMTEFAVVHSDTCGGPNDVACAPTSTDLTATGVPTYHALADSGALADRFFQTYAYADGLQDSDGIGTDAQNLIYLAVARFAVDPSKLFDTPSMTKELVRLQVPWAIYADPRNFMRVAAFGLAQYYDPDWSSFRRLARAEIEHDIAVGELPSVAVVLPDYDVPAHSEAPGKGQLLNPGIAYTASLVKAIADSAYRDDTLVLVTYMTAGGFYDHVRPPAAPLHTVDATNPEDGAAADVFYGPRVPLLALGRFARAGTISHTQLEMSSLTVFIEWNWLHNTRLKGTRESGDVRAYRDTVANNIGSLIDPAAAGIPVP